MVLGTAALAFVIGALTLTVGELVGGGSVGKNDRRTTLIPGSAKKDSKEDQAPPETETDQTETDEQPPTSTEEPPPTETETDTLPTTPEQPPAETPPTDTVPTTPTQP